MDEEIKENISAPDTWLRLLLIILFGLVANVLMWLVWIIAGVQFLCSLILGRVNENLEEFSGNLVIYLTSIFQYMVYRSDVRPFPFTPWEETMEEVGDSVAEYAKSSPAPTKKKAAPKKRAAKKADTETESE